MSNKNGAEFMKPEIKIKVGRAPRDKEYWNVVK